MGTLLIFLVIFLPMGWLLWRMLRFTRDTIGINSPLKVQRVYRTTFRSFFARIDYLFVFMCVLMGVVFINAAMVSTFTGLDPVIGQTILFVMSFVFLCMAAVVLIVDLNHWPYAYGVAITTFPDEHEIEIQLPGTTLRIKEGDIDKICYYQNNAKLQLGFAKFYLKDGDSFLLSFRTEGLWVIHECFKGIRIEEFVQHIPLISRNIRAKNPKYDAPAHENRKYGWVTFSILFLLGACFVVMTYMMYRDAKWQDDMSARLPVVCMKIKYGTRGAGTVRNPDNIYADYMGKTYNFSMGRKSYRSLLGVDTIAVYFDEPTGRAFLPTSGQVKHYTGLYVLLSAAGLLLMGGSTWEFVKIFRKRDLKTSKYQLT